MERSISGGRPARVAPGQLSAIFAAVLLASCGGGDGDDRGNENAERRAITAAVLSSTSADRVTGGDVLLKVQGDVPAGSSVRVNVNGSRVAASFAPDPTDGKPVGLVSGLANGANEIVLELVEDGRTEASGRTTLRVVNHPRTGPLFSGPQETPFVCETQTFRLYPDGPFLGPAKDASCSADTRVDYVYRTAAGTIAPLPAPNAVPADAATTTTTDGRTVPFVVRLETGTVNRAIYQTAVLHNPADGTTPSPAARSAGWNGKLVYTFGGGCTGGWYRQGSTTGGVLDANILQQGYAIASSSLNVFGNNCQDLTAAESMAMVKERFIEAYGRPRYTIGWGCSGGSYQQHQIADNYPGLLDGILPGCSFPEVGFATVYAITDMRLLGNYFLQTAPGTFSNEQQRQVAGIQNLETLYTDTVFNGAMRVAPGPFVPLDRATRTLGGTRTYCPTVLPEAQRYDPATHRTGARCDIYEHMENALGTDPATGFARRPLDNEGVQYGLAALNAGTITVDQFLQLNERIGGYDRDAGFQVQRTVADPLATRQAYQTGRLTSGGGGLKDVPIIDYRAYSDDNPVGDIHLRYHSFSMRERLIKANGDADNQVMLVEDFRYGYYSSTSPLLMRALAEMDKWLAAIQADQAGGSQHEKVVRNKPQTLQEGCNTRDATPQFIAEKQQPGSGQCAALYPAPPAPRATAGAPLAADVIKCTLKPVAITDYGVPFTAQQMQRLATVFPTGVCNWSVPGVEQQGLRGTWLTF
ncbi:DUF6351 family protein [Ramlibacter tataouinensis]|uniref:DUF6351 domain-containing protein n=1 Tax=Ramlibacter tataouinensis (strain ATCC BAA-407 / DSM 14655 / LMG 21543 / TTB310) TaxID=365046 RepID=F5Y295_RAMTT|nr:DUF6351 family protein [Ramlibacter tataouinensis]AEG91069.1 Hypothetical protein Rta_00090 [Ramlibacter tataouinensis TTB310]